jgi:2Fe-2S type ferredoxin
MGLRSRLLKRIKRTLSSDDATPAAPPPPKVYEPPPGTMPTEEHEAAAPETAAPESAQVEAAAPERAQVEAAAHETVEAEAAAPERAKVEAAAPERAQVEAAAPETVEAEAAPLAAASLPEATASADPDATPPAAIPQPDDRPVRIRNSDDGEDGWANDYATNDAPLRNAHHRPVFESSGQSRQVRVINQDEGLDIVFSCEPGEFILDAADRSGQELPFSCRSGGCLVCSAKVLSGDIEMSEQYVLEEEHIDEHFVLLCCSTPLSDIVVRSHQEENIQ